MNANVLIVIMSLLLNLLSGGATNSTTATANMQSIVDPRLIQSIIMFGGNLDMNKAFNQEYDKTYVLDDGFQSYGWGKGSTVRVHGNMNSGIYFDFDIKVDQHQQQVTVDTPVEGLKIVTNQYASGTTGYNFTVGPINLTTALQLFNYASSYMVPSTPTN